MSVIAGWRYGRLVALTSFRKGPRQYLYWRCQCDCGNFVDVNAQNLRRSHTKSCGCLKDEYVGKELTTHGKRGTAEYRTWSNVKARCTNPLATDYFHYGGRGIQICDRWRNSFENFYRDMGPKPTDRHSIERRNVEGNYEPNNCYWATPEEQSNNKRTTVRYTTDEGELSQSQLAEKHGLSVQVLRYRLQKGWQLEQALTTPVRPKAKND